MVCRKLLLPLSTKESPKTNKAEIQRLSNLALSKASTSEGSPPFKAPLVAHDDGFMRSKGSKTEKARREVVVEVLIFGYLALTAPFPSFARSTQSKWREMNELWGW